MSEADDTTEVEAPADIDDDVLSDDARELAAEARWEQRRKSILQKHGLWDAYGCPASDPDLPHDATEESTD